MAKRKKISKNQEVQEKDDIIKFNLQSDLKRSVALVFLLALALVSVLGFLNQAGSLGNFINKSVGAVFGWGKWLLPLVLIAACVILVRRRKTIFYVAKLSGLVLAFWSLLGFFHIYFDSNQFLEIAQAGKGGGYLGYFLAYFFFKLTGTLAGSILLWALFLIGAIAAFDFSLINFLHKINNLRKTEDEKVGEEDEKDKEDIEKNAEVEGKTEVNMEIEKETEKKENRGTEGGKSNIKNVRFVGEGGDDELEIQRNVFHSGRFRSEKKDRSEIARSAQSRKNSSWQFPPLDILEKSSGVAKGGDIEKNMKIIQGTLSHFGIEVTPAGTETGPTVTQYRFRPAMGVKLSKITALNNDLALALARHPIRIEAPIPGKSLIGIEVPNISQSQVKLKNVFTSGEFQSRKSNMALAFGEDVSGNYILADLNDMPHLLIAGSTGSGKSVCINSILLSLLYQNSPDDLKLILVDPKRVELSLYNGIPHLLSDVIVENRKVINALKWTIGEMERRYRLLQDAQSRDIVSYNQKVISGKKRKYSDPETGEGKREKLEKLPYIVIVIDELADLMLSHGKEVEGAIMRLTQMARAVGIHFIVSTQRPSVKVLTGLIKANITTRIALQVATQIDSRTILDMSGAEKLLGKGDMLFLSSKSPKPKRIQGVYVSTEEVKRVVKFIRKQGSLKKEEEYEDITFQEVKAEKEGRDNLKILSEEKIDFESLPSEQEDDLYLEAKKVVIQAGKASSSFLQRRLRVGYARAARLIDMLEENGVVGPADGAKPREVLIGEKKENSIQYEDSISDQQKREKWQI